MTIQTEDERVIFDSDSHRAEALTAAAQTVSVTEAARLLGRDRTRVYALLRSSIELVRGSASDSAIDKLLERGLVAPNPHHLWVTAATFLTVAGIRDLADLPSLSQTQQEGMAPGADGASRGQHAACSWTSDPREQ